eukprot:gene11397-23847_t
MSVIEDQLRQCTESLINISQQLNSMDDRSSDYMNFLQARFSLLEAILSLNHLLEKSETFIPGSICKAPRLYDGQYDLAIITKINIESQLATISWLRPRNKYELKSLGTSLQISRLSSYSIQQHEEVLESVTSLTPGDLVWARYTDGLWHEAQVYKRLRIGLSSNKITPMSMSVTPAADILFEVKYEIFGHNSDQLPASILYIIQRTINNINQDMHVKHNYDEDDDDNESEYDDNDMYDTTTNNNPNELNSYSSKQYSNSSKSSNNSNSNSYMTGTVTVSTTTGTTASSSMRMLLDQ